MRVKWLDSARGIGILLVVLGHIWLSGFGEKYIYSFHMPLFFLLAGYVYNADHYSHIKTFVIHKGRTLLIPYLSFSFITYAFWLLIERRVNPSPIDPLTAFLNIFRSQGADDYLPHNPVLWFLTCLFVIQIFFYFLAKLKRTSLILPFLVLSSWAGYWLSQHISSTWFWSSDVAFTGLVFYGLGYILKTQPSLQRLMQSRLFYLAGIILIPAWLWSATSNRFISLAYNVLGNYTFFYIAALTGSLLIILLAKACTRSRILQYLGKNSMIILSLHFPLKLWVMRLTSQLLTIPLDTIKTSLTLSLVDTFITLLILAPFIQILQTNFPFLLGKKKPVKYISSTLSE